MEIEEAINFLDAQLTEISRANLPTHSHNCPHCGLQMRYPTIARKQDIEDFRSIMTTAQKIMDKYGITLNILAEITANCHIELAKHK